MRKRHAARPMLESVEHRMVPSALGALNPLAEVSTLASLLGQHSHASTSEATRHEAAKGSKAETRAARHHSATTTHHAAHHSSSSSSSLTSSFSGFLKSIGL